MSKGYVELSALNGLDPLGFLASLGVLRLLCFQGVAAELSFDAVQATARIGGVDSVEEIIERFITLIGALPPGGLMVGLPPNLVPPATAEFSDPAHITHSQFRTLVLHAEDATERCWIRALWTDLNLDEDNRCATTPFYAPTGRQTLRTAFEKPADFVAAAPQRLLENSLGSWRRVDGFTGENLDYRAVRGAADQPDGRATMSGIPGATWLALSAIPLFPMGGDGFEARTLRWQRLQFASHRRRRLALSWPIWRFPLNLEAVQAVLAHSAIDQAATFAAARSNGSTLVRHQLRALGIERVAVAHRRQLPGGKAAGVLVPAGSWS